MQESEKEFLRRVHDVTLRNKVHSCEIRKALNQWLAEVWRFPGGLLDCMTLPNSRIEHCRTVVIVTGYALFVTSHSDVILTFPNQRFSEVCCHNLYIILHALLFCKDARKLIFVIM